MKVKPLMSIRHTDSVGQGKNTVSHEEINEYTHAWDDVIGGILEPKKVVKARMVELGYVSQKGVWRKMARSEAEKRGIRIVGTRWLDINKGDSEEENYRSRLVAKDFNSGWKEEGEEYFAATPPLEALKLLISDAATVEGNGQEEKIIMINDVARAFFEADMRKELCVELPEECKVDGEGDMVGYLVKSLYGTRDAAANFQAEVAKFMVGIGFERGRYNVCTFLHRTRGIKCLVHGDDFVSSGGREALEWMRGKLSERFEIKTKKVGLGPQEVKEARVLNRVLRVSDRGWEYEADQRHGELVVSGLGLEQAKGAVTPGEDSRGWNEEEEDKKLEAGEAREYRGLAARSNYLALDRPDIQYSTKEVCRGMSSPSEADKRRLRRLGRFLVERPRVVSEFRWQGRMEEVSGYSDSDWAGCRRTAKSTSGGVLMWDVGRPLPEKLECNAEEYHAKFGRGGARGGG